MAAVPSSVEDLVALLVRSRLLSAEFLDSYLKHEASTGFLPDSSQDLAQLLLRDQHLTQFQVDNLLRGKWSRFFVGPYKLLQQLGAGTAAVVYLALHTRMERFVAIKILQSERAADPETLERFYREARAAAALQHPNIVTAYDVAETNGVHYLVMEFVQGESLRQIVKQSGPLPWRKAADYLVQTASALQHAHERGLVHRDVRPANLMVGEGDCLKLLDLGLSLYPQPNDSLLTTEKVLGHAAYIAPEQCRNSHDVDARADIYSLGASFRYALTGKRPPRPGQKDDAPPASVPADMWSAIVKMMEENPDDRYATASEAGEAIRSFVPTEAEKLLLAD